VVKQSVRHKIVDAMAERIKDIDITPLEVLLGDMKFQYDETRTMLTDYNKMTKESDTKAELRERIRKSSRMAAESAEKVAPYLHTKLQAVTLKGDADNPINLTSSLKGLSTEDLATMEKLLKKVVG
jgi:oligoribonuclease (3'-5' exoribonuclease)